VNGFDAWWRSVPAREKPGLKTLLGIVLAAMLAGGVASLVSALAG
jgi:hypothetical protein